MAASEPTSSRASEQLGARSTLHSSEEIGGATRRLDVALAELHFALARRLGVSQPELAARGHLVREPHPADCRRLESHVTPHARDEVLRQILPLSADLFAGRPA